MATPTALEALLKRDRLVVVAVLLCVIVISWVYILAGAGIGVPAVEMTTMGRSAGLGGGDAADMPGMSMGQGEAGVMLPAAAPAVWTVDYAILMFFMWWIMMLGMMLPSAAPMILLHAKIMRKEQEKGAPYVPTGIFALGYIVMWAVFSLVAVTAQWALGNIGLISDTMVGTSISFGAGLLIAAGLWQLTPLKHACLRHCRSPINFLSRHWRDGPLGALRMGVEHGAYCLGCCWFLMTLLFYGGMMTLYWIAGLALFVMIEKLMPAGHRIGSLTGLALIVWGGVLLAGQL